MNQPKSSFLRALSSAIASAFGVQSHKNQERDFNGGRPIHFITAGLLLTIGFILTLYFVVQIALQTQ